MVWNEAVKINGADPDFHRRDLWDAIGAGQFPEWELGVQLFDDEFARNFEFDILDPTKIIPEGWESGRSWAFAVEAADDAGTPRFCGTVELRDEGDRRAEIAYGAHPWARGRGLMCAFDCPGRERREAMLRQALEHGLLLLRSGDRSLRMRSALNVSRSEVDEAYQRLRRAARTLSA